ncbi:hypothetical protein [Pseudomonas lactis]|uniref:hypothetical protein n=1 Tax=Pseudomonas lactis TaxID=1615674 RepID=UPI001A0628BB|nr:hypothetical protein [Pseudomonas lactis]MBA6043790.1 hypothetical protein [Pseudomonas lactis]
MTRPYAGSVDVIGIALKEVRPGGRHTGLVFYDREKKSKRFLHLAWHYMFSNEELGSDYFIYPNSNFNLGEVEYLAERAQRLWDVNGPKIAYGLDYNGQRVFDEDLKFIDRDGAGLTCATFVLAFFERCGFPVAELSSWLPRKSDDAFQKWVLDALSCKLTPEQYARAVAAVGIAPRYRPEEVVACFSHYDVDPINFPDAQVWGCAVLKEANMKIT